MPLCSVLASCSNPQDIAHSRSNASSDLFTAGEVITYTCDLGFVMTETKEKDASVLCQGNGFWQDVPTCVGKWENIKVPCQLLHFIQNLF